MNTRIRLAVACVPAVAALLLAAPASAHPEPPGPPPQPACPSAADLLAEGFGAQAANVFATLIRLEGCCAAI